MHDAYFEVGCDAVETNTFGSNWSALNEYDIPERIRETALAGARIAREAADAWSTPERPRWVLGSVGPGTKLPSLGHAPYATLRDGYQEQCEALIEGGVDALLVETSQDLLQTKASIIGAKRAIAVTGRSVPIIAQVTVELTGVMLTGSEIGAALTALEPLGIDLIGLNCATGPAEMTEHLRYLSQHARGRHLGDAQRRSAAAGQERGGVPPQRRPSWPTRSPPSSTTTASDWSAVAAAPPRSTCGTSSTWSAAGRCRSASRSPRPRCRRCTRRCRWPRTPASR